MYDLNSQEQFVIDVLRDLKPYERIEIIKDKEGKPDTFLVHRQQKIMVTTLEVKAVR